MKVTIAKALIYYNLFGEGKGTNNNMNLILDGVDKTGNLYNYENASNFIKNINLNYCYLVTADGGFDYSSDYNSQEISSYKLIYSEIYVALNIQKFSYPI